MAAILRDPTVAAVVRTRQRDIPLATITRENQFMGFLYFLYGYGAPLGGPSGHRSSAKKEPLNLKVITFTNVALLQHS